MPVFNTTTEITTTSYLPLSSDECEEISFFPSHMHKSRMRKQAELTDTFSIQEMTIDSDLESNDSQNLELLTPHLKRSFVDYLKTCFCLQPSS